MSCTILSYSVWKCIQYVVVQGGSFLFCFNERRRCAAMVCCCFFCKVYIAIEVKCGFFFGYFLFFFKVFWSHSFKRNKELSLGIATDAPYKIQIHSA